MRRSEYDMPAVIDDAGAAYTRVGPAGRSA
jgi:hypothetical protein